MDSINERLSKFLLYKNLSQTECAKLLGVSRQNVNAWTMPGGSFGLKPVMSILEYFPELDARWFITGVGSMISEQSDTSVDCNSENYEWIINNLRNQIEEKDKQIFEMRDKLIDLVRENTELRNKQK